MRLWYPHMCRPHTLLPETTSVITSRHCRMTCNKTKWSNCRIWRFPDALIFVFFFLSLIYVKVLCWFLSNGNANLLSLRLCFPFVSVLVSACPWRLFIGFCACYMRTQNLAHFLFDWDRRYDNNGRSNLAWKVLTWRNSFITSGEIDKFEAYHH